MAVGTIAHHVATPVPSRAGAATTTPPVDDHAAPPPATPATDAAEPAPKESRGRLAAITGGAGAGLLFFRDRVLQDGLIAMSLPRMWNDPTITVSKPKFLGLWALQLAAAEDSNAIVRPKGDLTVAGKTITNFWGKAFKLNHGLQVPVMGVMLASVVPNAKTAIDEDGAAGLYDTRSGRTATVSAIEGGYLATAFAKAAMTAKGQGVKAMAHAAVGHEGLGGTGMFVMLMTAENALVVNELGGLDFLGHKDTNEHKSAWKVLIGLG